MYLIKWIEEGKEKSVVADSWITELVMREELIEKGFRPTTDLI